MSLQEWAVGAHQYVPQPLGCERGVGCVFQGTQRCDAAPWHDHIPDTTRRHRQMVGAGQQKPKSFSPSGEQKKLLCFTQNDGTGKDVTCILMKAPLLKVYPIFSTQIMVRRNQSHLTDFFVCNSAGFFFKDQYLKSLCTYAASCPCVNTRFVARREGLVERAAVCHQQPGCSRSIRVACPPPRTGRAGLRGRSFPKRGSFHLPRVPAPTVP